jgi:hypothetical protein
VKFKVIAEQTCHVNQDGGAVKNELFTGKHVHQLMCKSECIKAEECLYFVQFEGQFNLSVREKCHCV